ncbi:LCP family protein [Sporofaciens musculi]|uniref:LCP family protein n=1 Tax=Sporofaciens musculi TaxID=2681861 RepID=UPI002170987A|nr:LCP family protein [Sporofaciens musculi]MCI9421387.1 LCP family protein [Dorea sp.]
MAREKKHYRRGRRKRGFAAWSLGKKIGVIFGGTVALVAATGAVILASKLSKIEKAPINPMELSVSEEARERGTGYLNVALFGVDSRKSELGKGTRSDTIMIASLNRETLEVKISSVYRDTLLQQDDGSITKANAAYSYGGPEAAVAMLNKNLDMDIEHYVTVNFDALIDVVDEVGGIEIDVAEEEIPYICGYAIEIMKATGRVSAGVTEPGPQVLNGLQATAYARIRYTAGDDFKRAERQRMVLAKIVEKLQQASPAQLNKIIDKVFPQVATNFTMAEILDYAVDAFDYRLGETTGFPFDKTTDELVDIGSVVIPVTLESNVEQLHKFFYGDSEAYSVSSTVSSISDKIVNKAGNRKADVNEDTQSIMSQPDDDDDYNYSGGNRGSGTGSSSNGNSGTSSGGTSGGGTGSTSGGSSGGGYDDDTSSGGGDYTDTSDGQEPTVPDYGDGGSSDSDEY